MTVLFRLSSAAMLSLFLAACAGTGDRAGDRPQDPTITGGFTVQEEEAPAGEFAFTIRKDGQVVTEYSVTHTKEMHFIVIRRDLEHFQHLHPTRDAAGVWRTKLSVPAGGAYWLFADFADGTGQPRTIRFTKEMPGEGKEGSVQPHLADLTEDRYGRAAAEMRADGYRVQVSTLRYSDIALFYYTVLDAEGNEAPLEDYLGAKGHSILVSSRGDFIHAHPEPQAESGPDWPVFAVSYPEDDFYRTFTQFQVNGKIITVDFDWNDPSPPPPSSAEAGEEQEERREGGEHQGGGHGG